VSGAASLKLNRAFLKWGPIIELQPIAVLKKHPAGYEFVPYFAPSGSPTYPTPRPITPTIRRTDDRRPAYSTTGHHVLIEPTLQAK
jgi:hypothetical protein